MYYRSSSRKLGLMVMEGGFVSTFKDDIYSLRPPSLHAEGDSLSSSSSGSPNISMDDLSLNKTGDYSSTSAELTQRKSGTGSVSTSDEETMPEKKAPPKQKKKKKKKDFTKKHAQKWTMEDILTRMNASAGSDHTETASSTSDSDESKPLELVYSSEEEKATLQLRTSPVPSLQDSVEDPVETEGVQGTVGTQHVYLQISFDEEPTVVENARPLKAADESHTLEEAEEATPPKTTKDQNPCVVLASTTEEPAAVVVARQSNRKLQGDEPEILYPRMTVTVHKKKGDIAGMKLRQDADELYIKSISASSIFDGTNLVPGQQLFAINGKSCSKASPRKVMEFLQKKEGSIAMTVSREVKSNSYTVTILKEPGKPCGLQIQRRRTDDFLFIVKISPTGPFRDSDLQVGQRILFINGKSCENKSAWEASKLFNRKSRQVSITVARPKQDSPRPSISLFSLKAQEITCPYCGYQGVTRVRLAAPTTAIHAVDIQCFRACGPNLELPASVVDHFCWQCAEHLGTFRGMSM